MPQKIEDPYMDVNDFFLKRPPIRDADQQRSYVPPHPGARPRDLFELKTNRCTIPAPRYIRRDDLGTMLMYIDGCCLNNGRPDARAGYGVVFREQHNIQARLERPPHGQAATSNRAELRAAICALGMRYWSGEGFVRIVLACDSEYVVLGACERVGKWRRNGWKTNAGTPVKNRDLWETLVAELERWEGQGVSVQFWQIPRELNAVADGLAKAGAEINEVAIKFTNIATYDLPEISRLHRPANGDADADGSTTSEGDGISESESDRVEYTGYAVEI